MNKNRKEKYPRGIKAYAEPEWNQKMEGCTNLFTISLCPQERRTCKSTTMNSGLQSRYELDSTGGAQFTSGKSEQAIQRADAVPLLSLDLKDL